MKREEFDHKWSGIGTDEMTDEQFAAFKEDCFSLYEETGFVDKFNSPYDDEGEHNGMAFKVVRRATSEEVDTEAMPVWLVEFENGDTAFCYPEEICKIEHSDKTVKTTWNVRRMSCHKEADCEDVATGLPTYGAALGCLKRIAEESETSVTTTSKMERIVIITRNDRATLYWIYRKTTKTQ